MDLKQYFTKAYDINNLMANLLGNMQGSVLLEPSVGEGSLLENINGIPKEIHAFDIDSQPFLNGMGRNNKQKNIIFYNECFIENFLKEKENPNYDAVISNPPYGLDFSINYRRFLKEFFSDMYVKESYSLFLYMSLMQLKEKGRYVFLIPDTFLTSHRHISIRKFLVNKARPTHVIRMPSKAFKTVNFQYANLCIIAGYKEPLKEIHSIEWGSLDDLIKNHQSLMITGVNFIKNIQNGWGEHYLINQHINQVESWNLLGNIADCKTGIYTGNNIKYIGFDPFHAKRKSNAHPICWKDDVYTSVLNSNEKVNGITEKSPYVPFVRGGHRTMFESSSNAILWDKNAVDFYKKNKKSRFQNSSFYFEEGIALPMVSSSRISASYMNNCVFDQGVVGIFPYDKEMLNILLLYLNSSIASKIMKSIVNGSANNSANYLKKLSVPNFNSKAKKNAFELIQKIKENGCHSIEEIDNFITAYI